MTSIPTPDEQPFLPLWPDVAEFLGYGKSAVYAAARSGRLPFDVVRVGGRAQVRTADLRRYSRIDLPA
jgi:hypothetical protein